MELGEGPCLQANVSGVPVFLPDLAAEDANRWPAFAAAALAAGVHAEFSLPLTAGPGGIGTLDLCRDRPGMLSEEHLADALVTANIARDAVLYQQYTPGGTGVAELLDMGADRIVIHQATGMIAAQLNDTTSNALARLRAAAFASGRPMYDIAQDVVERRMRFDDEISGGTAAQPGDSGQHGRRGREAALARVFVRLADTLASDFDVVDFLQGLSADAVEILEAEAAGVMLADPRGGLRLIASSERMRLLELFELQGAQGPCLDAFSTGRVLQAGAASSRTRWPIFAQHAIDSGFQLMCAVPLRVRTDIIGALNLFRGTDEPFTADEIDIAQAMAEMAAIGLIQERALRERTLVTEQLQAALLSRVVIEQAKGMLAEYLKMSVDDAFRLLRSYAVTTSSSPTSPATWLTGRSRAPR